MTDESPTPPGRADETASPPAPSPQPRAAETIDVMPPHVAAAELDADPTFAGPIPRDGVPGYEILREISRGGQAVVYLATQKSTGRRVAVKVMREGPFASARERARFDREVQVLAALEHPGVVAVLDRGATPTGFYYIVMQFVAGRRLDHFLSDLRTRCDGAGDPPDPPELLKLFMRICDAVNAAHLRGIVHRDLKPSNIIVGDDGEPRVLDFGLARAGFGPAAPADAGSPDAAGDGPPARPEPITITGQFIGSLPWASPEQAEGAASKIDTRSDVYSLGVVLYQMLTDTFPYEVAGTMRDVLNNILTAEPTPPSLVLEARRRSSAEARQLDKARRLRVGRGGGGRGEGKVINEAIEAIVLKALSKRREDRYQTAGEFGRDIANYLSGRPTAAAGPRPAARGAGGHRRATWIGAAAVLLVVAATTIVLVARRSGAKSLADANPPGADSGPTSRRVAPATAASVTGGTIPPGVPVELFVAIDLERDCEGELWQRLPSGLARDEQSLRRSALLPPVTVDGDYELLVHLQTRGRSDPVIALPVGDGYVVAHLQAWDPARQDLVVGLEAEHAEPFRLASLSGTPSPLTDGGTHVAVFRVQAGGADGVASVRATIDDKPVLDWSGTARLSAASDHRPKAPGRIGFVDVPDSQTSYSLARLNMLRGQARWLHASPVRRWAIGTRVLAQYGPEPYSYAGTLKAARGDREYLVIFDGYAEQWTDASRISAEDVRVGDAVLVNWKRKGTYYQGTVDGREADRVHVSYDDGTDSDEQTTLGMLRVIRPRPAK